MLDELKKHKVKLIITIALFVLFLVICLIAFNVGKKPVGVNESLVGLGGLNKALYNFFGSHKICDYISDGILILSVLVCFVFFYFGSYTLIRYKKFDIDIIIMGVFYIVLLLIYLLFNHIHGNYAPLFEEGVEKESFPSSHVLASVFIFISAITLIKSRINNEILKKVFIIACIALTSLMVVFRILSGCHWFTDIIASITLALSLAFLYDLVITVRNGKLENNEKKLS